MMKPYGWKPRGNVCLFKSGSECLERVCERHYARRQATIEIEFQLEEFEEEIKED